jgi:hypothetical protein
MTKVMNPSIPATDLCFEKALAERRISKSRKITSVLIVAGWVFVICMVSVSLLGVS